MGTVVDQDGRPAEGVTVYVSPSAQTSDKPKRVRTGKEGVFSCGPNADGTYFVAAFRVADPQFHPKDWKGQPGRLMGFQRDVLVKAGQDTEVKLAATGTETLSVTLAKPEPYHLEWGVVFVATSPIELPVSDSPERKLLAFPPDLLGYFFVEPGKPFTIHNVPVGTIHVRAMPSDPGPLGFSDSVAAQIRPGKQHTVALKLQPHQATTSPAVYLSRP